MRKKLLGICEFLDIITLPKVEVNFGTPANYSATSTPIMSTSI